MITLTFYSYKGGVGRSLTLTNLATLLAQGGANIAILDLDLEAPGMHYKLGKPHEPVRVEKGVVDYIFDYVKDGTIHDVADFLIPIKVTEDQQGTIHLFPAGNTSSGSYWNRLRKIDMQRLLYDKEWGKKGLFFFLELKERIRAHLQPDLLLIDARTGITELGGLATSLLAEKVVVVMVNNPENIDGTSRVLQSFKEVSRPSFMPPLDPIVLVNRIPANDPSLERKTINSITSQLSEKGFSITTDEIKVAHVEESLGWTEQIHLADEDTSLLESQLALDYTALTLRIFKGQDKISPQLTRALAHAVPLNSFHSNAKKWRLGQQETGDYLEFEAFLLTTIKEFDRLIWPKIKLASLYTEVNQWQKAEALAEQLFKIYPNHHAVKALKNTLRNNTKESNIEPNENPLLISAKQHIEKGQYQKSLEYLDKLLTEEPNSLEGRLVISKVHQQLEEYPAAEHNLLKVLNIKPTHLNARIELAKVYQQQGEFRKAIRYLEEYIELDPRGLHPRTELAKVYQQQGELKKAQNNLIDLLALDAKNLQARTELAKVYQQLGEFKKAEAILLDLLKLDPNNLLARTELAKVYQQLGEFDKAEQKLKEIITLDQSNLYAHHELTRLYKRRLNNT